MNTLKLKVVNGDANQTVVRIDGKDVQIKKGKHGSGEIVYTTDAAVARVTVHTFMEIKGKWWWLTSLFYFFISIFGIFDRHSNWKCWAISYDATVALQGETQAVLRVLRWRDGQPAVALDGVETKEKENKCFVDTVAKKRRTLMRFVKLAIAAAAVIIAALLIV